MKKLDIFDFDGTLFNSPLDKKENHDLYEKHHGIPWLISKELSFQLTKKHGKHIPMRRGWWGKGETLRPPLVPDPVPESMWNNSVVERFHQSKNDPDSLTVILTGRHVGIKNDVLRICAQGNLFKITNNRRKNEDYFEQCDENVKIYFLGDNGPGKPDNKPGDTKAWKIWMIGKFLEFYPEIESVEFWEDRDEHLESFQNIQTSLNCRPLKVIVNHIKA